MMATQVEVNRRAFTEGVILDDHDYQPIDINNLDDNQLKQLARNNGYQIEEDESEEDEDEDEQSDDNKNAGQDSDVDNIDFKNFKGIYFNDDPNRKFQCPDTGAHFEYFDLCKRLVKLKDLRIKIDKELGIYDSVTTIQGFSDQIGSTEKLNPKNGKLNDGITDQQRFKNLTRKVDLQKQQDQQNQSRNNQKLPQHNSGGSNNNQVLTLQRRQIRAAADNQTDQQLDSLGQKSNQQISQGNRAQYNSNVHNQIIALNEFRIRGHSGMNMIGQGNYQTQDLRSKSLEKRQQLIIGDKTQKQQSQRGQQIQQLLITNNHNSILHRKQQSQFNHNELQRVDLQNNNKQSGSNQDLKKQIENQKRYSNSGAEAAEFYATGRNQSVNQATSGSFYQNNSLDRRAVDNNSISQDNQSLYAQNNVQQLGLQSAERQIRQNVQIGTSKKQVSLDSQYRNNQQNQLRQNNNYNTVIGVGNSANKIQPQIGTRKTRNNFIGGSTAMQIHYNNNLIIEDYDKPSPYVQKQKQQMLSLNNKRLQTQLIQENIEINGKNPYSRNRLSDHIGLGKAVSYNNKAQDLLLSFQQNTNTINNIKQNHLNNKRLLNGNNQFRQSFGSQIQGPLLQNRPFFKNNHLISSQEEIALKDDMRPITSGGKVSTELQKQHLQQQFQIKDKFSQGHQKGQSQNQRIVINQKINNALYSGVNQVQA
ncbi:UNKNOWN [Stylonychia lemnae]|uniref:Uncharacterized protein n=1 Tax=Stylonychia lemnae TaxID=5949 RepID=A0A077ZYU3_STYLE|nr:UNKNOWN [Stylonychia lemnae]|eukprot:CDW75126.1 UNKNOWN [Stylonychia lemnae]